MYLVRQELGRATHFSLKVPEVTDELSLPVCVPKGVSILQTVEMINARISSLDIRSSLSHDQFDGKSFICGLVGST